MCRPIFLTTSLVAATSLLLTRGDHYWNNSSTLPEGSEHPLSRCTHILLQDNYKLEAKRERVFYLKQRLISPLSIRFHATVGTSGLKGGLRAQLLWLKMLMKNCLCYHDLAVQGDLLQLFGLVNLRIASLVVVSYRSSRIFTGEVWEGHWSSARTSAMSSLQRGYVPGCCKTSLGELVHDPSQENWLSSEAL